MASRFQFALPDPRSRDGWARVGNLDLTTTAILVIASVVSLVVYAIRRTTFLDLAYHPGVVRDGDLWRVVTWPLAVLPSFWLPITFAFFWFVGHMVEELVGKHRYLSLVAAVTIVPAVLLAVLPDLGFPANGVFGLRTLASVMFIIFAAQYPQQPFFFGIPAWGLAAIFIGLDVIVLVSERWWGALLFLAVAAVLGLFLVRQWGFAEQLSMIPRLSSPPRRGTGPHGPTRGPSRRPARSRKDRTRNSGRGQVVDGPWAAPAPPKPAAPNPSQAAAQAELDSLLDKISANGLDSLSAAEKQRLNELSKRLR